MLEVGFVVQKPNYIHVANELLEIGLVIPSHIIFGLRTECYKLALQTKQNHVCIMD